MATRQLKVEIVGDASGLHKALGKASKSSSGLSRSLATLGKVGIAGAAAAFVGLGAALKVGFGELADGQKVAAQTAAVLKSTGGEANVTAKHVDDLSQSLSKMTGIDDEVIGAGENMLLTFTNIRNEVGKGNDVFDQSTRILADMSVALGTDMNKSAIQLGKALNDPIKGITALTRVGVTFTKAQKDQIKAMVDAGDTMGAQKLILKELNKEFGGSAKAAGETFPGQLNKLKNAFEDAAAGLATALLPFLLQFASWVNQHMPEIQEGFRVAGVIIAGALTKVGKGIEIAVAAFDKLKDPASTIFGAFKDNKDVVIAVATAFATMVISVIAVQEAIIVATAAMVAFNAVTEANPWVLLATALLAVGAALVVLYLRNEQVRKTVDDLYAHIKSVAIPTLAVLQQAWERFGSALTAIGKVIFGTITLGFRNMFDVLQGIFNIFAGVFTGDWRKVWTGIKQIFDGILGNLVKLAISTVAALLKAGLALGKAIIEGIRSSAAAAWPGLSAWLSSLPGLILSAFTGLAGWMFNVGRNVIQGLWDGLVARAASVLTWAENFAKDILKKLGGIFQLGSPSKVTIEMGKMLAEGLGIGFGLGSVTLDEKMATRVKDMIDKMIAAIQSKQSAFASAFSELTSAALAAFDKVHEGLKTKAEKALEAFDIKKAAEQAKERILELKAAMLTAQDELKALQAQGPGQVQRTEGMTDAEFQAKQLEAEKQFQEQVQRAQETAFNAQVALQEEKDAQKEAKQRAALEKRAAKERAALDDRTELQRRHFEEDFTALQARLQREGATREEAHQAVIRLMQKYRIPFKNAAALLGSALAEGLNDSIKDVDKAAKAVRDAILDKLSRLEMVLTIEVRQDPDARRQHGGPVKRRVPYLVGEAGPELFVPNSAGRVISNNRLTGSAGGGGGAVTNVFNFPHYVGSRSELQQAMQTAVADWGRRNSGQFFAGRA